MLTPPEIVEVAAQVIAFIPLRIPRADIRKVMGPGLQELTQALSAQQLAPIGSWMTHHLSFPPDTFDFRIVIPVAKPGRPSGRVEFGTLPASRVARAIYRGDYSGLGAAWPQLDAWVRKQGGVPLESLWEVYAKGPETGAPPAQWETQLNRPLAG